MEFKRARQLTPPILGLRNVQYGRDPLADGDALIFKDLNLGVDLRSRVFVKRGEFVPICAEASVEDCRTALLELIVGAVAPSAGERRCHPRLRVGYLPRGDSMAEFIAQQHDVIVMDNPTHGWSAERTDELARAIDAFNGGVVIGTDDDRLRFHVADAEILTIENWDIYEL